MDIQEAWGQWKKDDEGCVGFDTFLIKKGFIKTESKEGYRPYKSIEELFHDRTKDKDAPCSEIAETLLFSGSFMLKWKNNSIYRRIVSVSFEDNLLCLTDDSDYTDLKYLFNGYLWADGTPCGIKEEKK